METKNIYQITVIERHVHMLGEEKSRAEIICEADLNTFYFKADLPRHIVAQGATLSEVLVNLAKTIDAYINRDKLS